MLIPTDIDRRRIQTEEVDVTGVGTHTITCPTGKQLCVWLVWEHDDGSPNDPNTQGLLKFGSRIVSRMGKIGNGLVGLVGPLVTRENENVIFENEDGGAGVRIKATVSHVPV